MTAALALCAAKGGCRSSLANGDQFEALLTGPLGWQLYTI
jgi:hypothetical protein